MDIYGKGVYYMTYMEFLEALVNAESEDERMELVKANADTFAPSEGVGEDLQGSLDEMTAALEEANATITSLKQEIKDRFFGKYKEDKKEDDVETEDSEDDEKTDEEPTLADLGFGKKTY